MNNRTILLAGSGRSGTTWLANIIAANPTVRVIFEPFDNRQVEEMADLPLSAYSRRDDVSPIRSAAVGDALAGRINTPWTNRLGHRVWAPRRVVKSIRANSMLAWIDRQFKPVILYMLRHPCSVVLSRMRLSWDTHIDEMLDQQALVDDYLTPYLPLIQSARTPVQRQAIMWCLENVVALNQMPEQTWTVVTYEQLVTNPDRQIRRVLNAVDVAATPLLARAIRRNSVVTRPDSPILSGNSPITEWQNSLTSREISDIVAIVADFDIDIYDRDPMPHTTNLGI